MERIEKLKEMLAEQPGDSFLQHALALEYIKAGDDGQARFLFEQILAADENYIGSYFHLARLLERNGETSGAIGWYEKGMQRAMEAGDRHAYNELRAAYEELADD
jgi:Tfp pilus assembly protein PilF